MKRLVVIKIMCAALLLNGCCTDSTGKKYICVFGPNASALKMAFAVAIRSLEGSPLAADATKIPAAIQKLADSWLPITNQYSVFVKGIIDSFVAAHPVTIDQVNKVLESIAMTLQTSAASK